MSVGYLTPLLHVSEVEKSIGFYERIGFRLIDVEGATGCLGWARMHTEDGSAIMLARTEQKHAVDPDQLGIILVLYAEDLAALRESLVAAGDKPSPIEHPPWMPSGMFIVSDPDGYPVGINQWGNEEHTAWLAQLEEKRARGVLK